MQKKKCTAIVLAAGKGKRMGTKVQKQYLEISGKPILYYSLFAFEQSTVIDDIILVVGQNDVEYCQNEIVMKYGLTKVKKIVQGGAERHYSVWNGLQELDGEGYVFIHDGARPFINEEILNRVYNDVIKCKACVVGMPVKDTIKIADYQGYVSETPDRKLVWMIQTPQVFDSNLVKEAYSMLMNQNHIQVTDDAMVVEQMLGYKVKLTMGSYKNIKITTPEDLDIAEIFVNSVTK